MKIAGQDLTDILQRLPWPYRIVVAVSVVFLIFLVIYIPLKVWGAVSRPQVSVAVHLPFASAFDPSLAQGPQSVWMAYAAQDAAGLIGVHLATTADSGCNNWQDAAGGFEPKADDILAPDGHTVFRTGSWRIETPSLVYDPGDPAHAWKLYAYKYFWAAGQAQPLQIAQHYGMIVYKYAADPAGPWSAEQWLMSPGADYPPPPYDQMVMLKLNALHPSLQNVIAYARPSVVAQDGVLWMTLSAFTQGNLPDRVVMLASRDHGGSWVYVGTLLQTSDLAHVGPYQTLAGATLLVQKGKLYLAAVLGAADGMGTYLFAVDDPVHARLHVNVSGAPEILREIPLREGGRHPQAGGFAAVTAACPDRLLTGEQRAGDQHFQIFNTASQ